MPERRVANVRWRAVEERRIMEGRSAVPPKERDQTHETSSHVGAHLVAEMPKSSRELTVTTAKPAMDPGGSAYGM